MKALSIRQPWAWLIVNGYKAVENRSRSLGNHTGPLLIHASSRMTFKDYEDAWKLLVCNPMLRPILQDFPVFSSTKFEVGGIVGMVDVAYVVDKLPHLVNQHTVKQDTDLPWYLGEVGYMLEKAKPLPFKACKGRLGFFDVDYEGLPA